MKPLHRTLVVTLLAVFASTLVFHSSALHSSAQGPPARDAGDIWGPRYKAGQRTRPTERYPNRRGGNSLARLHHWNEIAINASGLDHTPVAPEENRIFGEQLGPGRSSRAMAIVHIAIFDAINAITGQYQEYSSLQSVREDTSVDCAMAQAAHDTLTAMYPSQSASFDQALAEDLDGIPAGRSKTNGIDLGHRAAEACLVLRGSDGSQGAELRMGIGFIPSNDPGKWRQDPISLNPLALGANWGAVTPFVLSSGAQFRAPVFRSRH